MYGGETADAWGLAHFPGKYGQKGSRMARDGTQNAWALASKGLSTVFGDFWRFLMGFGVQPVVTIYGQFWCRLGVGGRNFMAGGFAVLGLSRLGFGQYAQSWASWFHYPFAWLPLIAPSGCAIASIGCQLPLRSEVGYVAGPCIWQRTVVGPGGGNAPHCHSRVPGSDVQNLCPVDCWYAFDTFCVQYL